MYESSKRKLSKTKKNIKKMFKSKSSSDDNDNEDEIELGTIQSNVLPSVRDAPNTDLIGGNLNTSDNIYIIVPQKKTTTVDKKEDRYDSSKLAYYITIDMELRKGTSLSPKELADAKCTQKWNTVRKTFSELIGKPYTIPPVYTNKDIKNNSVKE